MPSFRSLCGLVAAALTLAAQVDALALNFTNPANFNLSNPASFNFTNPTSGLNISQIIPTNFGPDQYKPSKYRLAYHGSTGMAVSWSTPKQLPKPAVFYGTNPLVLDQFATSDTSVTYDTSTYYSNHVVLNNLKPNTKYYYIVNFGDIRQVNSFTTALPAGDATPYQIAVVADLGTMGSDGLSDHVPPGAANPLMTGEVNTIQRLAMEKDSFNHFLHVGDIAYADYWLKEVVLGYINGTVQAGPQLYERINEEFFDEMAAITSSKVYSVAPGNHDSNCDNSGYKNYTESICPPALTNFTQYNQHWNMPSSVSGGFKNMWYSYDVGQVHYLFYDTETDLGNGILGPEDVGGASNAHDGPQAPSNAQIDFIKKDLASVDRSKTPWVVAAGHRPWYLAVKPSSLCTNCQKAFEDIFNQYGVDIIFSGHQHNMQRSDPIASGGKIDPNGLNNPSAPLYITTGAGGHFDGLDPATPPYPAYTRFVNDTLYGFSRVTFHNRTHLTHEFVSSATNAVLDSATLYKKH